MNKSERRNNFNILRFLFASLVIVSHVPELQDGNRSNEILTRIFGTISFGEMAVDSFFVLSGFLIVKSWLARPRILPFLTSRILRIYPGFIASALVCALIVGPLYGEQSYLQDMDRSRFLRGLVTLNLVRIPPVFPGSPHPALNGALWTIPYEFTCYLLVLFCGLTGILKQRWIWLSLFLSCAAVHVACSLGTLSLTFDVYFRFGMLFAAGGCFYLYRNQIPWRGDLALIALLVFAGLLFIAPLAEPAVAVMWGYAILYYAMNGTRFLWYNRLPDISYGVYLYAWPINKMVLWHFPALNIYAAMTAVFALSVLAGIVSWYLVERPFMKLKKLFRHGGIFQH